MAIYSRQAEPRGRRPLQIASDRRLSSRRRAGTPAPVVRPDAILRLQVDQRVHLTQPRAGHGLELVRGALIEPTATSTRIRHKFETTDRAQS